MPKFSTVATVRNPALWRIVDHAIGVIDDTNGPDLFLSNPIDTQKAAELQSIIEKIIDEHDIMIVWNDFDVINNKKWAVADLERREIKVGFVSRTTHSDFTPWHIPQHMVTWVLTHELAHFLAEEKYALSRSTMEFEASTIAYLTLAQFGLDYWDRAMSYLTYKKYFRKGQALRDAANTSQEKITNIARSLICEISQKREAA